MNIARPNPFCEALSAPQRMGFRYGKILYTEDVGGSSPSSPTIKSSTYGEFAKTHRGSVNLANAERLLSDEYADVLRKVMQ